MLSSLSAESDYVMQAALDSGFTVPFPGSFRTEPPPPSITGVAVAEATADGATVTVTVDDAVTGTRVHLRYRVSGNWLTAQPVPESSGTARFTLSALASGATYRVEASLDNGFAAAAGESFSTETPAVTGVVVSAVGIDAATVTVTVDDPADATRVHLRFRVSGAWTTAEPRQVTGTKASGTAAFTLEGLSADSAYQVQAALDSGFTAPFPESFMTDPPPPEITGVAVDDVTSQSATVQVDVSNAVADTTVHLRYRVSGAWTTVQPPGSGSSGTAQFTLSSLTAGTEHEVEAALDSSFTTPSPASFTTNEAPQITSARTAEVTHESAEVTVSVANAASSTRVFLRYGVDDGDPNTEMVWTTVSGSVAVGSDGTATFMLSSLSAESDYVMQAALDSGFTVPFPGSFATDPRPPSISGVAVAEATADGATVTVTVDDAVTGTRVHLRYRVSGNWLTAQPVPGSSGTARFTLSALASGATYRVEASLDNGFAAAAGESFSTETPAVTGVVVSAVGIDAATVTVTVDDPADATRVHLRFRVSGAWTTAEPRQVTGTKASGTAAFTLEGLSADSAYQVQAALDSAFTAPFPESFMTDPPPPSITRVAVAEVSGAAATVQVEVSNAVADTMVHLRYRVSGAWTTVQPPVSGSSGTAKFTLSGLTPGTPYELQAALDRSFTTSTPGSLTTLSPSVSGAATSEVTHESATVTVSVANAASSTRVFLRYGVDDGDPDTEMVWTRVSGSVRVGSDGSAAFALSSLSAESDYAIQAALDSSFATPFPESFRTDPPPPPEITGVAVGGVTADSAAVTVTVDDAVTATRVHLRFRPLRDTQWTPVRDPAPVSALGVAVSTLGGLAPGTDYEVQAALDPRFTSSSSLALFTTRPRQAAQTPGPPGPGGGGSGGGGPGGGGSGGGGSGGGGPEESEPEESEPAAEEDDPAVLAQAAASEFDDVTTDAYYAPAVGWMVQHGITAGCAADSFCPEQNVSRQQFVTFLWRAAGRPQPATAGSQTFTDVTEGSYADTAIGWAAETGVTQGCATADDGTARFCPHRAVTRAQASALLYRHADARADTDSGFADVDPTSYYARAAAWMAAHGITNGCAHDSFCPHRTATRAQAATFIYRVATNPQSWGPDTTLSQPRTNTPTTQPMTTHRPSNRSVQSDTPTRWRARSTTAPPSVGTTSPVVRG